MKRLIVILSFLVITTTAVAECYHNGEPYPTGAEVNGYVCSLDGTWVRM